MPLKNKDDYYQCDAKAFEVGKINDQNDEFVCEIAENPTVRGVCSLQNLPCGINGLALANVGFGVMWLNLSTIYKFRQSAFVFPVVVPFTIVSIIMIFAYVARIFLDPKSWVENDTTKPATISTWGSMAMAICLIAVIAIAPELQFPFGVPFSIGILGSVVQLVEMSWFLYRCVVERCWPEPFYNAAVHACLFPVLGVPGKGLASVVIRRFFLSFGLLTVLPSILTQLWRVLRPRTDVVANNPSVCIMQTAVSISLSAWLVEPLTGSATSGVGRIVSNFLFSLSTTVYVCTWIAMYQRREVLLKCPDGPIWSATTFPFANSAISANLYSHFLRDQFPAR